MLPPDSKTSPSQLKRGKETFSNVWSLNARLGAGVGHTSETEVLLEPGSFESHRLKTDFLVLQNLLLMRYSLISTWTQTEKPKLEKKVINLCLKSSRHPKLNKESMDIVWKIYLRTAFPLQEEGCLCF